jgi:hypothetical protein
MLHRTEAVFLLLVVLASLVYAQNGVINEELDLTTEKNVTCWITIKIPNNESRIQFCEGVDGADEFYVVYGSKKQLKGKSSISLFLSRIHPIGPYKRPRVDYS